jgi:CRISPR-associated protein Csd2
MSNESLVSYGLPLDPTNRMVISFVIEVALSNPNGDPERGGGPRVDLTDGRGIISPQCQKRWIRDYAVSHGGQSLFIERGADLGAIQDGYAKAPVKSEAPAKKPKKGKEEKLVIDAAALIADKFDLRVFGGLLPRCTIKPRGAFQFAPAVSVDPIEILEEGFTRCAGNFDDGKVDGAESDGQEEDGVGVLRGTKNAYRIVRYGLYRGYAVYNPILGKVNGVTAEDISLVLGGLIEGLDFTRSAHRVNVNLRRMYVIATPNERGSEPGHVTNARIKVENTTGMPPSKFEDYAITVDESGMPKGMTISRWEERANTSAKLAAK